MILALIEMEILKEKTLLFSGRKERPTEAPFVARK
jgi:hypothetical protein